MIRTCSFLLTLGAVTTMGCASDSGTDPGHTASGGAGGGGASCTPTSEDCYVGGPTGPGAECMALADNGDNPKIQMRVSMLQVTAPPVLAQPFMQDAIITKKITFKREQCNLYGDGQYNVLFEFDTAAKTVTTGGALPHELIGDPKIDGACYANFTDPTGIEVKQTTSELKIEGNKYSADFPQIVVPIFLENKADSYVLLPLTKLHVEATISEDHNCIGKFLPEVLDPDTLCAPPEGEFAWQGGGSYTSLITVQESDEVNVQSLGYTLCVLLSGDVAKWKGPPNADGIAACKDSDGYVAEGGLPTGDWCESTNKKGDSACHDAFRLETTFAASAIKINGDCK